MFTHAKPRAIHIATCPVAEMMESRVLLAATALPAGSDQSPFPGPGPAAMPGYVLAVDFDRGGEGVSYHDIEAANTGDLQDVRPGEGVDIGTHPEWPDPDRPSVVDARAGEWLEYTIDVPRTGVYGFRSSIYNRGSHGTIHVEFDGVDKSGPIHIQSSNTPTNPHPRFWTDGLRLDAGIQVMRIVFESDVQSDGSPFAALTFSFGLVPAPVVTIGASGSGRAVEGGEAGGFSISSTPHDLFQPVYAYVIVEGTAVHGADYEMDFPVGTRTPVWLPPGNTTQFIVVRPRDDSVAEGPETVTLTVLPGGYEVSGADTAVLTIVDDRPPEGSIAGYKFNDVDGDGVRDANEPGLAGSTIYLDSDRDGRLDTSEPTTVTDDLGRYRFVLDPGRYRVRDAPQAGWRRTRPAGGGYYDVSLFDGTTATRTFGATQNVLIRGTVFNDANGDRIKQGNEPGLSRWRVYIDANNDGLFQSTERSVRSDWRGQYVFRALAAGSYVVRVVLQTGWQRTAPDPGLYNLSLASGQSRTGLHFGQRRVR